MITSHSNGDLVPDDEVFVIGSVTDADDDPEDLRTTWLIDGVEACPSEPPDESGTSRCLVTLGGGETDITLRVLDPLNAAGQDKVTISVLDTSPPEVQIDSPLSGSRFYTDRKIALMGTATDAEDTPTDLDITWTSDVDGKLDIDTNVTSDGSVSAHAFLSPGEHAITLEAEDSHGKTGSDAVLISVGPPNTPPTCAITSPEEGTLIDPSADTMFSGTGLDADQDAHTLSATWTSDADGVLGTTVPTTAGDIDLVVSALSGGTHIITLTLTDELGDTCTDSVVVQVGTPPTIAITAPVDEAILAAEVAHVMRAEVSDNEDDPVALSVQWRSSIDGVIASVSADETGIASTSSSLSLGTHSLTATVFDTHGLSAADTIEVTVDDTPVVSDVRISPDPASALDALTCAWTYTDATGADASTVAWSIDGVPAGTGPTLSSGHVHTDSVSCTVTPFDGALEGAGVTDTIVVSNTPPSIMAVVITPGTPTATDTLTCAYGGFTDVDGEADASTMTWTRDGVVVGTSSTLTGPFTRGEAISCTVTPHDGTDAGTAVTQTVTVANTPPEMISVTLTPSTATTLTTLTAVSSASDAEGDPITLSYQWTVDGIDPGETSSSLSGATTFSKGQVVQVIVTPSDGMDAGTAMSSAAITVQNTPPVAPTLVFVPDDPVEGEDDLWCAIDTPAFDEDGDPVTLEFTWAMDGVPWSSPISTTVEPNDTIEMTETTAGDEWTCTVTPHDGDTSGTPATIDVTIDNAQTRVFVTQEATSSDFGGPAGTDAYCQAVADDAGLGGTWTAYVSGGGASAITRIADGPYHRLDGALIAVDKADLTDGSIAVPISINEHGTSTSTWVCTGSSEAGYATGPSTASGGNCAGWTRGCGVCGTPTDHWYVEVGRSDRTNDDWSTAGWSFCGSCHLYCFEN